MSSFFIDLSVEITRLNLEIYRHPGFTGRNPSKTSCTPGESDNSIPSLEAGSKSVFFDLDPSFPKHPAKHLHCRALGTAQCERPAPAGRDHIITRSAFRCRVIPCQSPSRCLFEIFSGVQLFQLLGSIGMNPRFGSFLNTVEPDVQGETYYETGIDRD